MSNLLPEELSDDDVATLVEALEAWENKDQAGLMMQGLFESSIVGTTGDRPGVVSRVREIVAAETAKLERAAGERKERSVVLRAKLIGMRKARAVERVVNKV